MKERTKGDKDLEQEKQPTSINSRSFQSCWMTCWSINVTLPGSLAGSFSFLLRLSMIWADQFFLSNGRIPLYQRSQRSIAFTCIRCDTIRFGRLLLHAAWCSRPRDDAGRQADATAVSFFGVDHGPWSFVGLGCY